MSSAYNLTNEHPWGVSEAQQDKIDKENIKYIPYLVPSPMNNAEIESNDNMVDPSVKNFYDWIDNISLSYN